MTKTASTTTLFKTVITTLFNSIDPEPSIFGSHIKKEHLIEEETISGSSIISREEKFFASRRTFLGKYRQDLAGPRCDYLRLDFKPVRAYIFGFSSEGTFLSDDFEACKFSTVSEQDGSINLIFLFQFLNTMRLGLTYQVGLFQENIINLRKSGQFKKNDYFIQFFLYIYQWNFHYYEIFFCKLHFLTFYVMI